MDQSISIKSKLTVNLKDLPSTRLHNLLGQLTARRYLLGDEDSDTGRDERIAWIEEELRRRGDN